MTQHTKEELFNIIKAKRQQALEKLKQKETNVEAGLADAYLASAEQANAKTITKAQAQSDKSGDGTNNTDSQKAENEINPKESKKRFRTKDKPDYYEYNLSKMKKSYGGYIVPEHSATSDLDSKNKTPIVQKTHNPVQEAPLLDGKTATPKCKECGSIDIDSVFFEIYDTLVCSICKKEYPEKYSLLTKSEARQDYLLTEGELSDPDLFKVWVRPNPHRSTFSNMLLYVREHVETYAIKKWGSLLELDKEFERRLIKKGLKKEEKLKKNLRDLRVRTRTEKWREDRNKKFKISDSHQHVFSAVRSKLKPKPRPGSMHESEPESDSIEDEDENEGSSSQKCDICGLVVEIEEF